MNSQPQCVGGRQWQNGDRIETVNGVSQERTKVYGDIKLPDPTFGIEHGRGERISTCMDGFDVEFNVDRALDLGAPELVQAHEEFSLIVLRIPGEGILVLLPHKSSRQCP